MEDAAFRGDKQAAANVVRAMGERRGKAGGVEKPAADGELDASDSRKVGGGTLGALP